jgi:hypothetical protein
LKSVTPAKAHVQKRTENTGYCYALLRVQLSPELQQQTFGIGSLDEGLLICGFCNGNTDIRTAPFIDACPSGSGLDIGSSVRQELPALQKIGIFQA